MIHRITARATFRSLSRSRDRVSSRAFTVVRTDGPPPCPTPGIGLACSTSRRLGSAVVRNRARRRVRAVVREWVLEHPSARGWYLVVVQPGDGDTPFAEFRAQLRELLDRLDTAPGAP